MDKEKFIAKCRELDWRVADYNGRLEIGTSSPAGEDFRFSVDEEDAVAEVRRFADNYNADDHAAEWYGAGVGEPSSLSVLLYDAECIAKSLNDLATALENMDEEESDWEQDAGYDVNQQILRTIQKEYDVYKISMIEAGRRKFGDRQCGQPRGSILRIFSKAMPITMMICLFGYTSAQAIIFYRGLSAII